MVGMDQQIGKQQNVERIFRLAAVLMVVAIAVHDADHLRRGLDVPPLVVITAGFLQIGISAVTLILVFTRNRWSPHAAIAIGFAGAVGFLASHMLPHWGFFSDSFIHAPPDARVTAFSWITAILEIGADTFFGVMGVAMLRAQTREVHLNDVS
jgi:hypothetical protein